MSCCFDLPLHADCDGRTGYGHHGDYVFGSEGDALQSAMDKCTSIRGRPTNCTELKIQTDEEMNACAQAPRVDEKIGAGECELWCRRLFRAPLMNCYAVIEALPGCNPIQQGPEPATLISGCTAVSTTIDLKPTATSV